MPFDRKAFIEGFIAETSENLAGINDGIIALKKVPDDKEQLTKLLRQLHTIKGTARMLGFNTIEKTAHGIEDVFKGIREEKYELTDRIVQLTFSTADYIKKMLSRIAEDGNDDYDISALLEIYEKASSGLFFTMDSLNEQGEEQAKADTGENLENITSIRIDLERINAIVKSFSTIIIRQFRFKKQLEKQQLSNQLKEDLSRIEEAIFETQNQILNLRMLPLDIVLTPLKQELEKDAIQSGKDIDFDIPQTSFLLDKVILEQLRPIMLHLVRNSLDHGIEPKEERLALGKAERGKIAIHAAQVSNNIRISISDDGRGIQYEKIRRKAIEINPEQREEIAAYSESELQKFLFMSGFSTAEKPTLLSGRGVGLDVVRSSMEAIKGKMHLYSQEHKGTTFELLIPLTLATQEGLFICCGGMKFMLPANYIYEIVDADSVTKTTIQEQTFIRLNEHLVPVYHLSSILGKQKVVDSASIIVLEYLETHIGITVDSIDQYENLIVNPLPVILQSMDSLQGIVFDENYAIIPILDVPNIMERLRKLVSYDIKKYNTKNQNKTHTVLIVDDSTTTRQIEQTIFESSGYLVETAVDGIDALEKLKSTPIDAIVTDINMPRMDGIMLLNNVRRMEQHADTPVIIVSGAYDPEAKEQFLSAGAQAFIVKSDFQRGNLLQAVKEFLGG